MKIKLSNVRLAFPQLFEATTVNGEGKPTFSATFLLDPIHPDMATLNSAIECVAQEKWKTKADAILKTLRASDKVCLRSGDNKTEYAGFEGNFYVSTRNVMRPLVIDRDKTPLTLADGRIYAGCFVNASITLWAQDNNYGKRINASLSGVQFAADAAAFTGGGPAVPADFDDLAERALSENAWAESLV